MTAAHQWATATRAAGRLPAGTGAKPMRSSRHAFCAGWTDNGSSACSVNGRLCRLPRRPSISSGSKPTPAVAARDAGCRAKPSGKPSQSKPAQSNSPPAMSAASTGARSGNGLPAASYRTPVFAPIPTAIIRRPDSPVASYGAAPGTPPRRKWRIRATATASRPNAMRSSAAAAAVPSAAERLRPSADPARPGTAARRSITAKPQALARNTANQPRSSVQRRIAEKPPSTSKAAKSSARHLYEFSV